MITLTKAQRAAVYRLYCRLNDNADYSPRYRDFRATVQPGPGCAMVKLWNIWIGIESDGYTHS